MPRALYFIVIFLICSAVFSVDVTWDLTGSGNWNNNASWTPAQFPNAPGDFAKMLDKITSASSIPLGQPITIGQIQFDNANNYTITSNNLIFQTTAGSAVINVTNGNGNGQHGISSNITLNSPLSISQASTSPFTLSGAISGSQTLTYSGPGIMMLSGSVANSYSGLTTVNGGTLRLSKTAGVALVGNARITGGKIETMLANQLSSSANITISGTSATLDLNGLSQNLGSLNFQSGSLSGAENLHLNSNTTALIMRNVTIGTPLNISGKGDIVFDAVNGGTANLNGNLNLTTNTFNIANGTAATDMLVAGIIQSGSPTKSGGGTLEFTGTNSYSGATTVNAGTLKLNGGAPTIPGNLVINGGNVLHAQANQVASTATVVLNGGVWNLNSLPQQVTRLDLLSGDVINIPPSPGSANLDLTNSDPFPALLMRNDTLNPGMILLSGTGQVVFDAANQGTATIHADLDLGGEAHSFNIGNGEAEVDMNITGVITNGSLTKVGSGTLEFSGDNFNLYMGQTTVKEGTLSLNKTRRKNAIAGNILVNGGSLSLNNAEQIADTATVQITSGNFSMNGFNETISNLNFQGGNVFQSNAMLSLNGAIALSMQNDTTLNGPIRIIGGGNIQFVGPSGTATINGPIDLATNTVTFNIANGTNSIDMLINGVVSNGSMIKTGSGSLFLGGDNSIVTTNVQEGMLIGTTRSLQGTISSNPEASVTFNQDFNGSFSGVLNLSGGLNKTGSGSVELTSSDIQTVGGTTTVSQGTLVVNGTLSGASGALNVSPGATLAGSGTINKDTTIQGTLAPGNNSIDTLTINGNTTLASGSTFTVEITPTTSDFLDITGGNTLDIQSISTFEFVPQPAAYVESLMDYTVAQAEGGISGMFTRIIDPFPLFESQMTYSSNAVFLRVFFKPISSLPGLDANAKKVANCLDKLNRLNLGAESDLYNIINSLRFIKSVEKIERALLSIQPSIFTALPILKEASTLYFLNALYERMDVQSRSCREVEKRIQIWFGPIFGITGENNHGKETGYDAFTPGAALGVDGFLLSNLQLGGSLAYTHSYVNWKRHQGEASIDAVYGSLFGRYNYNWFSLEGALISGYNYYSTTRNIRIGGELPIRRSAIANHHGFETSVHMKGSVFHPEKRPYLSPFLGFNFLYLYESRFNEAQAKSLNLAFSSKHSNLLQTEVGVEMTHCHKLSDHQTFSPYMTTSFIWEKRFSNDQIKSYLDGCSLDTRGYSPSRILLGIAAGFITEWDLKSAPKICLNYKGKYGLGFADSSINLELIY